MWYRSTEHSSAVLICSSYNKTAFIWKFAKGIDRVAKFCNTRSYNIKHKGHYGSNSNHCGTADLTGTISET